jgi:hypothetical protein
MSLIAIVIDGHVGDRTISIHLDPGHRRTLGEEGARKGEVLALLLRSHVVCQVCYRACFVTIGAIDQKLCTYYVPLGQTFKTYICPLEGFLLTM